MPQNVLVFNTAADQSGAVAELERFVREVAPLHVSGFHWHLVLGLAKISVPDGFVISRYAWTKRSWISRIWFDIFWPKRIAATELPIAVVSLQNTVVPIPDIPQILYVQLCFPFIKHRFSITEPKLWIYQNLHGALIRRSIKKADIVVVQNDWMKDACIRDTGCLPSKFRVLPPAEIILPAHRRFETVRFYSSKNLLFFYPATAQTYKNHVLLIEAFTLVKAASGKVPQLIFTLKGDENKAVKALCKIVKEKKLDVEFRGIMPREGVMDMYAKSILVFPSLLETIGLPLVEAKACGSIIFAYDAEYSRDVLKEYSDAHFFRSADDLAILMMKVMDGSLDYRGGVDRKPRGGRTWQDVMEEFFYLYPSDSERIQTDRSY